VPATCNYIDNEKSQKFRISLDYRYTIYPVTSVIVRIVPMLGLTAKLSTDAKCAIADEMLLTITALVLSLNYRDDCISCRLSGSNTAISSAKFG